MEAYYDPDASLDILRQKTLGIIGYGNQGRAQALNLRDSGLNVIVGSLRDESAGQAEKDGFVVRSVAEVAERANVMALLIPDEVQREVYNDVLRLAPARRADPGFRPRLQHSLRPDLAAQGRGRHHGGAAHDRDGGT